MGRDRVLGIAAGYGLDGVGIKLTVPVAERSKAVRLLVCLCCVLYSRDKRQEAMTIKTETRADTVRRENMRIKKILVGARFSASVQNGPGAHQASYAMGTGSLSWA